MPMKNDSTFIFFFKKLYLKSLKEIISPLELSGIDFSEMNEAKYSPSEEVVRKIIDFARTFDVLETESAGEVEMNLN
jgi:hypothetical protein